MTEFRGGVVSVLATSVLLNLLIASHTVLLVLLAVAVVLLIAGQVKGGTGEEKIFPKLVEWGREQWTKLTTKEEGKKPEAPPAGNEEHAEVVKFPKAE